MTMVMLIMTITIIISIINVTHMMIVIMITIGCWAGTGRPRGVASRNRSARLVVHIMFVCFMFVIVC